jgi:hypothetical protein
MIAVIPGRISVVTESTKSESSADMTASPLRPQAVAAAVQNPEIGRIRTAYAVVFRGAFAASASWRAEIASKAASFACSIDAMA